jgi:two-component system alkaline phosphatase synthesis response regulator PhoP
MAKILIIDDDPDTIKLLEAVLNPEGHETSSVQESRNALQAVETFMPDLVLLDIMMPEINGIAVCKLIKSKPATSRIKVMMVSALSDEGTRRDSFNAGADQFVTKPILPRIFARQVNDLLA